MAVLHFLRLSLHHSLRVEELIGSSGSLEVRSRGQEEMRSKELKELKELKTIGDEEMRR